MPATLEVLFAPAEFAALADRDLTQTLCVVFDIFRATTTIVTALANGAAEIIPVAEIPHALALRQRRICEKTIVLSTTNGSRALRACARAQTVLIGSFLNLRATADFLAHRPSAPVLLVCSGTGEQAAYEDILGAGALAQLLWPRFSLAEISDSATAALQIYQQNSRDLMATVTHSRNGRRLLSIPDLRDDVAWCLQRDVFPLVAKLENGSITKLTV
jgi:2-phosphosulfolactate phosphatase